MSGIGSAMSEIDQKNEEKKREEEFRKSLPCGNCKLAEMCKYVDSIPSVDFPEFFHVEITCKYQAEYSGK